MKGSLMALSSYFWSICWRTAFNCKGNSWILCYNSQSKPSWWYQCIHQLTVKLSLLQWFVQNNMPQNILQSPKWKYLDLQPNDALLSTAMYSTPTYKHLPSNHYHGNNTAYLFSFLINPHDWFFGNAQKSRHQTITSFYLFFDKEESNSISSQWLTQLNVSKFCIKFWHVV